MSCQEATFARLMLASVKVNTNVHELNALWSSCLGLKLRCRVNVNSFLESFRMAVSHSGQCPLVHSLAQLLRNDGTLKIAFNSRTLAASCVVL